VNTEQIRGKRHTFIEEHARAIIRERMESVVALRAPLLLAVGYGPSWADAH
jgi:DNA polymerase I-like protein with 3'-5' exonuclease and polymerase domains